MTAVFYVYIYHIQFSWQCRNDTSFSICSGVSVTRIVPIIVDTIVPPSVADAT